MHFISKTTPCLIYFTFLKRGYLILETFYFPFVINLHRDGISGHGNLGEILLASPKMIYFKGIKILLSSLQKY